MKEVFILVPHANGTELQRMFARYGKNTFNVRFVDAIELAETALIKSGIANEKKFVSAKEEAGIFQTFAKSTGYFSDSYHDAKNLAAAIFSARSLIVENEETTFVETISKGEFADKNKALIDVYNRYIDFLNSKNLIDRIGTIRMAIEKSDAFEGEFLTFKEFPLSPIEEKLLKVVSNDNYHETSIPDFISENVQEKPLEIEKEIEAYGVVNEVEAIIETIFENKLPLDQCTVAITDTRQYGQEFYDLCSAYDIPVTFGAGIPISNSNPAALLNLIYTWDTSGFHGIDALSEIISSSAFNKSKLIEKLQLQEEIVFDEYKYSPSKQLTEAVKFAGLLKLSFDKAKNSVITEAYANVLTEGSKEAYLLNIAVKIFNEFEKGYKYLIRTYSNVFGARDSSAKKTIEKEILAFSTEKEGSELNEIIPEILSKMILSSNSKEGFLHVVPLTSAICTIRENLFIAGLSADKFPGSPRENYILLDNDYKLFNVAEVPTSDRIISSNQEKLEQLIHIANYSGSKIYISFSNYETADLKAKNKSSAIYKINDEAIIKESVQVGFFDAKISNTRLIGQAYNNKIPVTTKEKEDGEICGINITKRRFSPSSIETYLDCPKKFFYKYIIGLKEEDENDPFVLIKATELGTLLHSCMEKLNKYENDTSKEEFIEIGLKEFDSFIRSRSAMFTSDIEIQRGDFIEMLETAYDMDEGHKIEAAEEKAEKLHEPSGITIYGYPDRIETSDDGKHIIVDFKTGKTEKTAEDVRSCIQTMLYSFVTDFDISDCEYWYVRSGNKVHCSNSEAHQQELDEILMELKTSLDTNTFDATPGNCTFCKFGNLCGAKKGEKK